MVSARRRRGISPPMLEATYLLPLKTDDGDDVSELAAYLRGLARFVDEVIVVDASSHATRDAHRSAFGPDVQVLAPTYETPMGKVANVCTGIEAARHDAVVIADDDVRYEPAQLIDLVNRLSGAAVVRPQNYFEPLPWHARVDTARTLLARVSGGDWPGTLAVRRSAVLAAGGYAGDVMFENLELVRTIEATGGSEQLALDLLVRRHPPTTAHFWSQQIRQAYDEFARPARLLTFLAVAPATIIAALTSRRALTAAVVAVTTAAEVGRRRAGGRKAFPVTSVPLAAPWVLWRSLFSWAALGARLRGGVRYRGIRLRSAATSRRQLRRRFAQAQPSATAEPVPEPAPAQLRPNGAAG